MVSLPGLLLLAGVLGAALLGTPCPEWANDRWVQGGPLRLADLRGKVVLVRFFMNSECPYCRGTAPALNEFDRQFGPQGLVVVGMYTPKPKPRPASLEEVKRYVDAFAFRFPVAVDDDWATLRRLWLDRVPEASYTSASLLIDRKGIVRHVQGGGLYARDAEEPESRRDYWDLERAIRELLAEP
jgi:thiol-disulfide isomerase/thioredoxin